MERARPARIADNSLGSVSVSAMTFGVGPTSEKARSMTNRLAFPCVIQGRRSAGSRQAAQRELLQPHGKTPCFHDLHEISRVPKLHGRQSSRASIVIDTTIVPGRHRNSNGRLNRVGRFNRPRQLFTRHIAMDCIANMFVAIFGKHIEEVAWLCGKGRAQGNV